MLQKNKDIVETKAFKKYEARVDPRGIRKENWRVSDRVRSFKREAYTQQERTIKQHYKEAKDAGVTFITDINDPRLAWILNETEKQAKANDWCSEFADVLAWLGGPRSSRMDY